MGRRGRAGLALRARGRGRLFGDGAPVRDLPALDGALGAGSNLGFTNPVLLQAVGERVTALGGRDIPVDLVTASASGLDPDISAAAAYFQVDRVARARGLDPERVRDLVESEISPPLLGFLGPPRVNVLALNLALVGIAGP